MSSKHPGESQAYQHKILVKEARTDQRALLANAKRLFYQMELGDDHRKSYDQLNRLKR
jgi:hypothetical protein